jgi:hypothetical protein
MKTLFESNLKLLKDTFFLRHITVYIKLRLKINDKKEKFTGGGGRGRKSVMNYLIDPLQPYNTLFLYTSFEGKKRWQIKL